VAIVKGSAEILSATGTCIGRGIAYVHLPRGKDLLQTATGTVSCTEWHEGAEPPEMVQIEGYEPLTVSVSREAISECSRNHILRFSTSWTARKSA